MGIRGVIFDLDGVLVNTDTYHYLAWKRLLKEYGKDFTEEDNEQIKGVSRSMSLEIILKMKGIEMSEVEKIRAVRKKNNWYLEYITAIDAEDVFDGVAEFLDLLHVTGYRTAIGSTSDNAYIVLESTGLYKYFDVIIDGYLVKAPKPDPEVYLVGAKALSMEPAECVVFEDSLAGVLAARRAGMRVIGVSPDKHFEEADRMVKSLKGLDDSIFLF